MDYNGDLQFPYEVYTQALKERVPKTWLQASPQNHSLDEPSNTPEEGQGACYHDWEESKNCYTPGGRTQSSNSVDHY